MDLSTGQAILRNLIGVPERQEDIPWTPFQEGVERHWLYQDGEFGPAAALLRFQPGARVPEHLHMGFEHILVLAGSQSDDHGTIAAGDFMVNAPGTRHRVASAEGCLVLAIYEKRVSFSPAALGS